MQRFTRTELAWIIKELDSAAETAVCAGGFNENTQLESALLTRKTEMLSALSKKLNLVVKNGDKRIEVTP